MGRLGSILCTALLPAAWFGCAAAPPPASGPGGGAGSGLGGAITGQGGAGGGRGAVTFAIRSDTSVHPISPFIYGLNSTQEIATTRQTVVRLGGNRWTAYNWENNASNAGADWHYQNDGYLVQGMANPDAPGEAVRNVLQTSHANGAAALLTVPNVDYVSADKKEDGDVRGAAAGSPDAGTAYLQTRFKLNQAKRGSAFSLTPDVSDGFVYQDEFVNWVKTNFSDGPVLFDLDNEPDIWSDTHPEVHPAPVTYAELVERNRRFAGAIKDTWPDAKVLGFVSYGWNGFTTLQDAPDAKANGDFINYYLDSMSAQSATAGTRLIDYLDLHWYPEAKGGSDAAGNGGTRITGADTTDAVVEARVQAPRSLWDPNYTEVSWITKGSSAGPIRLIPRMKEKIAARYPGTELAFSEWNYGGGTHISGGIATADVLGILGREGVALACNWDLLTDQVFMRAAIRAYRNFDGAGGHFGDTSIEASTSDVEASSVYASVDSTAPDRMVIVAINKRIYPLTATIQVAHTMSYSQADVFTLTASAPAVTAVPGLSASTANQFVYTMPAQSVSVIVPKL